jgi:formate hydrogenlyase subunit 3/multisubunit Na+/H+ antiporter MnhD subunit
MPPTAALSQVTTDGGYLMVLSIALPVLGILFAFTLGGRQVERLAGFFLPAGLLLAAGVLIEFARNGTPLVYVIGGWQPPLGIALRADGLAAAMMAITAMVICAVGVFAAADFRTPSGSAEARAPFSFWILLLGIWSALNMVFVSGDLFTLYVALELVTFAAVPLVCLDGRAETLQAALRYLLFALIGSVLYLGGVVLLYGAYGTLDITLLSQRVQPQNVTFAAAALITVGLLAKTALFPLHIWLPPAHAGAPAAGSAVLSALVVKASFFITVRFWFDVMPGVPGYAASQLIAALGGMAIVFGSVLALRQERLKLLIAYSTLAQIGYLFLMFGLAFDLQSRRIENGIALSGGMLQAMSHATAKAAMFMAAGLIYAGLGHDRITGLGGIGRALPLSVAAFALGGIALVGVPPGGAALAKDLLLQATAETGQWWWGAVIQVGGTFTSAYLLLVLAHALMPAASPISLRDTVPRSQEVAALVLAVCSLLLGLFPWDRYLTVPHGTAAASFDIGKLLATLVLTLVGGILAILLGRWAGPVPVPKVLASTIEPARRIAAAVASPFERLDVMLRRWPAAGLALLALMILFAAAKQAGR